MRHLKLTISYDGTDYVGWQVQSNGISIQQRLEEGWERLVDAGRIVDVDPGVDQPEEGETHRHPVIVVGFDRSGSRGAGHDGHAVGGNRACGGTYFCCGALVCWAGGVLIGKKEGLVRVLRRQQGRLS